MIIGGKALDKLKNHVHVFEKKVGFDKTGPSKLLGWMRDELKTIQKSSKNKKLVKHKLMDLQLLIFQLANRYNANLDREWKNWWAKSRKYRKQKV